MQKKQYVGLSDAERSKIEILKNKGYSIRKIAGVLGRSSNTISREIRVNSIIANDAVEPTYVAQKAKQKSRTSRRSRRFQWRKIEHHAALRAFIIEKLSPPNHWSPDSIAGYLEHEQAVFPYVSTPQIYAWLYSAYGQPYCQHLLNKRYRPKHRNDNKTNRVMIPDRVSITERPPSVEDRKEAGHWEGDTVISGKRTRSKAALAVAQERTTRLIGATLIPNLKPASFTQATNRMLTNKRALTLSLDNGIANKRHKDIRSANGAPIPTFFCDPYSSYQKGGVEHANKMLRRYLPKGCDLGNYTQAQVDDFVDRINRKPRRCLGYKSALQLATEKGII